MPSISFRQILLAGFGAILVGFLGALGWDMYSAGKEVVSVSIVGSNIPVHLLVFGAILIAGLALLILALWKNRSERTTVDPRFAHLTIHYSQRTDTPDIPNPARPRLVVDNRRKRYYWVSTWLEPYIRQHKINWHSHDGEKALRTWLKKEKIEPHETDPTPEEIGLENLLETDRLSVEPKKSIGKVEEKSPLIEVYSPIHAMIVRVNREIPRESALQLTVGMPVKASLIDSNSISAVFNQHNDKLRKKDLDMWLEIEKEIKARNCFFLGKDRQKWFDELETEYNRLTKH